MSAECVMAAITAVGVLVAGGAAVVAWCAYKAERKGAATRRIDDFIVAMTTGKIAVARDRVARWCNDRSIQQSGSERTENSESDQETRKSVFEMLWLLQRSAGLRGDLEKVNDETCKVVYLHFDLITENLRDFGMELDRHKSEECSQSDFKDSSKLAWESLKNLRSELKVEDHDWSLGKLLPQ